MRNFIRRILLEEVEKTIDNDLYQEGKEYINTNKIFNLKDLRQKNEELYNRLVDGGVARKLAHDFYFDDAMGPDKRKIYVYTWEEPEKVAYVGLTCDVKGRHKKHTFYCSSDSKKNTAVGRYMIQRRQQGLDPMPNYDVIVAKYLDDIEAAEQEQVGYDLYSTEYKMLNDPSMIGNLGATRERSKYDTQKIWETLNLHDIDSIEELERIDPELADYVKTKDPRNFGIKGEKAKSKFSIEDIKNKALEVGKEGLFKKDYPHWYRKLLQSKDINPEEIFKPEYKIEGRKRIYRTWNELMSELDPSIRQNLLKNRLNKKGEANVYDKSGNMVKVTYPNFMEEALRRKLQKMLLEISIKNSKNTKLVKEKTESPEVLNTSGAEDDHKEDIQFIRELIKTVELPHICYMDVIYNDYADEYRVQLTLEGGITQWSSNNMFDTMSHLETQAKHMKGINLNMYMPNFIYKCDELEPGIQRL